MFIHSFISLSNLVYNLKLPILSRNSQGILVILIVIAFFPLQNIANMRIQSKGPALEMKLLLVPLVFLLLRIWSAVMGVFAYFKSASNNYNYGCLKISVAILFLNVS